MEVIQAYSDRVYRRRRQRRIARSVCRGSQRYRQGSRRAIRARVDRQGWPDHALSPVYRHARRRRGQETTRKIMTNPDQVTRTVAIVTGASRGIGRATAIRLARDFAAVVVVARNAETLADRASRLRAEGAAPLALALDLREPAAADEVVKQTLDRYGRIDALINVAGAVPQTDLFAMTDTEWN